jgi:hypothetical protein
MVMQWTRYSEVSWSPHYWRAEEMVGNEHLGTVRFVRKFRIAVMVMYVLLPNGAVALVVFFIRRDR